MTLFRRVIIAGFSLMFSASAFSAKMYAGAKPYEGIVRYDILGDYTQAWDCPENASVLTECLGGYRILRIIERDKEGHLAGIWIAHPYHESPTITPEYIIDVSDFIEPVLGAQRVVYAFRVQEQPGKTLKQSTWSTFTVIRNDHNRIIGIQHAEHGFFNRNHTLGSDS